MRKGTGETPVQLEGGGTRAGRSRHYGKKAGDPPSLFELWRTKRTSKNMLSAKRTHCIFAVFSLDHSDLQKLMRFAGAFANGFVLEKRTHFGRTNNGKWSACPTIRLGESASALPTRADEENLKKRAFLRNEPDWFLWKTSAQLIVVEFDAKSIERNFNPVRFPGIWVFLGIVTKGRIATPPEAKAGKSQQFKERRGNDAARNPAWGCDQGHDEVACRPTPLAAYNSEKRSRRRHAGRVPYKKRCGSFD